jgi:tetraacyldisaccharide 4'-kinase
MRLNRPPKFWWRRHSPIGYALAPLGAIYGRVVERRMTTAGAISVGVPVICVGNVVIGGSGKTPTAIEIANICRQLRLEPGFLTRGYRGRESGPVLVSLAIHTAVDVGDEPLLLAQHAPTVVAADRPSGAKLLASLGIDVIVMDDGLQNPTLQKDLSIVVMDAHRGTGNGWVFPAGPLRAPAANQIRRADALVLVGDGKSADGVRIAARAGRPVLHAAMEPVRPAGLKSRPYLAFAGIADPAKFHRTLAAAEATIGYTMNFPDHHNFSDAECQRILAEAQARGLVPITTEKDRVRLYGRGGAAERLCLTTETLPVRVRFEEQRRAVGLITDAVARYGSAYRKRPLTPAAEAPAPA